ncbi:MAG: GTPase, partial [Bacteroidota bacterium]|nr:GTPase [Bacteroidota bacterium]
FVINDSWYLVDLPGYGYAKVSKKLRADFSKIIKQYLKKREQLLCLFVLIDSRIKPQDSDLEFMEYLGIDNIPFVIVFTKSDKLKPSELEENLSIYKNTLLESWEDLPQIFVTSATKKTGRNEILDFIESTNSEVNND